MGYNLSSLKKDSRSSCTLVGRVFCIKNLVWRAGAARGQTRKEVHMPGTQDDKRHPRDDDEVDRMVNEGGRVPPRTQTAAPQPQPPAEPPKNNVPTKDVSHR